MTDRVISCDIDYSVFFNGDNTLVEEDDDNKLFGDDWEWVKFTCIDDHDDAPGPPLSDC